MYEFYSTVLHSLFYVSVLEFDVLKMLGSGACSCDDDGRLIFHPIEDDFGVSMSTDFK